MRFFPVLIFSLLAPILQAQEIPQQSNPTAAAPYVEKEVKQFNFYPGGKVAISSGLPGSLKIVGWKKGSVSVEAEKIFYNLPSDKAQALPAKSPLRVRHTQTSATIQTSGSLQPPATMEINLTVYVPGDRTDMTVQMDRGDFSVESVNGWIEVSIKEGSLDAKSMAGYFSGNTQRGDIYVEMSDTRWRGYDFAAITQSGSVELKLPKDYSAALQLEAHNGKIIVNYPPQEVEGELVPPEIVIKKNAQMMRAAVGDGGASIRLASISGDITLSLKEEKQ